MILMRLDTEEIYNKFWDIREMMARIRGEDPVSLTPKMLLEIFWEIGKVIPADKLFDVVSNTEVSSPRRGRPRTSTVRARQKP